MDITQYFLMFLSWALVGLAVVVFLLCKIKQMSVKNEKAAQIAAAIRGGAMTFLREEYKLIAIMVAVVAIAIAYFFNLTASGLFIAGSLCSMITGLIGMHAATQANVRTTVAAQEKGEHGAFLVAFFGGG